MVATPVADGLTQDVITLVTIAEKNGSYELRDRIRSIDPDLRVAWLRSSLIDTLAPFMWNVPVFVQSIVARAILDYVDWESVVQRLVFTPEDN